MSHAISHFRNTQFPGTQSLVAAFNGGDRLENLAFDQRQSRLLSQANARALLDKRVSDAFVARTEADAFERLLPQLGTGFEGNLTIAGKGQDELATQNAIRAGQKTTAGANAADIVAGFQGRPPNDQELEQLNIQQSLTGSGTITAGELSGRTKSDLDVANKTLDAFSESSLIAQRQERVKHIQAQIQALDKKAETGRLLSPTGLSAIQRSFLEETFDAPAEGGVASGFQEIPNPKHDPNMGFIAGLFADNPKTLEGTGIIEEFFAFQSENAGSDVNSPFLNATFAMARFLEVKLGKEQGIQAQQQGLSDARDRLYENPQQIRDALNAGEIKAGDKIRTPGGIREVNGPAT